MSLIQAFLFRQSQTLRESKRQRIQLNSNSSQTQIEQEFSSHSRQIEFTEKLRQVRENYYLERRSFW
jgi:hypothetical protein